MTNDIEGREILGLANDVDSMAFEDAEGHQLETHAAWCEIKRRLFKAPYDPLHHAHAMVQRFNEDLVGIPIPDRPTLLSFERGEFRLGHLREELEEIESAIGNEDLAETADGLVDLAYVALGTLVEMGITAGAAFEEVHLANMRKERGEKATRPGSLGYDAVKPRGWTPPDLEPYLILTREQVLSITEDAGPLDERIRAKRLEVWQALDQGNLALAHQLDREEHALWAQRSDTVLPIKATDEVHSTIDKMNATVDGLARPKLLVIGHARHGKDTLCETLRDRYGFQFTSSSTFCAEHVVMPYLRGLSDKAIWYDSVGECFEDRSNHRALWFEAIRKFNRPDPTALARAILWEHDVYCGMRSSTELHACRNAGLFDHVIWVDASERVGPEDRSSCTVEPWMADYVVDANGSVGETAANLDVLMGRLL